MRLAAIGAMCLPATGCFYILGEPDFRNVAVDLASPPADGASAADTAVWPILTADRSHPPVIVEARADVTPEHVELHVRLGDFDGDLMGGTLVWTDGDHVSEPLVIPDDLDVWLPRDQVAVVYVEETPSDCSISTFERTYSVEVTDVAGHRSGPETADPVVIQIVDAGESQGRDRQPLGAIHAPALHCGFLGEDEERARWGSQHHPGGTWSFTLTFEADKDAVDLKIVREDLPDVRLRAGVSPQVATDLILEDDSLLDYNIDRVAEEGPEIHYQVLVHH